MPRRVHRQSDGLVFHVLNRSVRRAPLFTASEDYKKFETVLGEALERVPTRLLAYCVMPNHWYLVLWPHDAEMSRFMHWLTLTHARRWHLEHGSRGSGPVYQNRFKSIPVQSDRHLLTLLRYVERNALRAGLADRAESWRWSSLWQRCSSCATVPLAVWPIPQPADWVDRVNQPQSATELSLIQAAVANNHPFGNLSWTVATAAKLKMAMRAHGRPSRPARL
jgi:putative transposase